MEHIILGWLDFSTIVICRGVQKTEEPKKLLQTDRTVAKFWFGFGFIIQKIKNFGSVFDGRFECTESTKIYYYIICYINRLIQTQSKLLQYIVQKKKKIERLLARKGVIGKEGCSF